MSGRSLGQVIAAGLFAAGLTFGIAHASSRGAKRVDLRNARATGAAVRLAAPTGMYVFHPGSGHIVATTSDRAVSRELALDLVVDGEPRPLTLERSADLATERNAFGATFGITIGDEVFDALIDLRVDPPTGALMVDLAVYADASAEEPVSPGLEGKAAHQFGLRLHVPTGERAAFVCGLGEVADLGAAPAQSGRFLEIDADPHALGVASAAGSLDIAEGALDQRAEITAATKSQAATPDHAAQTGLRFLYAPSSTAIWKALYQVAGEATARVAGVVTGSTERARIFGLDAEGLPRVRAQVSASGRFEVFVPPSVSLWYAAIDAARVSTPVVFPPGTPWDLRLDVSPGGEIDVKVTDADTGLPLLSRIIVHGIDGTLDPSFGPDYRASGAGPLVDALHGEVTTPLPAGRYRVSATRGLEWSIDAKTVDVVSGRSAAVDLALRHVVPTPGVVSCDLHVHARPSFDTPVLAEDRVLSLVSAGIDFAVPSEHNIVGDYGPALQALDLTRDLATVQGVEITTFAPRFGHFGLYPYSGPKTPPYKATTVNKIFDFAHKKAPGAILQVNHPRLTKSIGYFDIFHFDPHRAPPYGMRTDFDTLEVYNGYDLGSPDRVDAVLQDWFVLLNLGHRYAATGSSDSHRIQYQWAGYPRTMIDIGPSAEGPATVVDPLLVV
ncbi:MAG TPA: CehA/McbA family metallohydrolase, partial [Polyangiaceae bacterium]